MLHAFVNFEILILKKKLKEVKDILMDNIALYSVAFRTLYSYEYFILKYLITI